jgi:hypothetical protein
VFFEQPEFWIIAGGSALAIVIGLLIFAASKVDLTH